MPSIAPSLSLFALLVASTVFGSDTPDLMLGEALFRDNCAVCHGAQGEGAAGPRLVGDASAWSPALFARAVLEGIDEHGKPLEAAMPHWQQGSFASDQDAAPSRAEVDAIHAYLGTLSATPSASSPSDE